MVDSMSLKVRDEVPQDTRTIAALIKAAFRDVEHSDQTEHLIVEKLRRAGALTVSLVAVEDGIIRGHVAVSPVTISSGQGGWYGLGPISVWPEFQGRGLGSELMRAALSRLQEFGAPGCVVLGEPGYYGRFGFEARAEMVLPGVPSEYFQAVSLRSGFAEGEVAYHRAFG